MFTHTVVVDINTLDKVLLYLEMHLLEQKSARDYVKNQLGSEAQQQTGYFWPIRPPYRRHL